MVDEVEEKSAIEDDSALVKFTKALEFSLDQPLERMADTFKAVGFEGTEKFLRDLTEEPENYLSASEEFMKNNGMGFSWEYLPRAVVEQLGSLAGSIATRAAGAAIGGTVAGPGGVIAGAITAPALFEIIQILGPTVYERARNEGREEPILEDWLAASPTTLVSAALGTFGASKVANLNNLAKKSALRNITTGALAEGATEGAQSLVEQTGTTAFSESGLSVDARQALGEGIIGAGTGGGINAVTESGKLFNIIENPSDSYLTEDPPTPTDVDLTGVELIAGQPKIEDLKRKDNVFRGSGLDLDVTRTTQESPVDYLNRLIQQEFKLPGSSNISYNDLRIKTPRLLAHELGIAPRTVAFEDPTLSLTEEQQRELDEAYAEYESNNKINKLKRQIEDLNYLSESDKADILREVDNAVEDAVGISGLYADLDEDVALPTGVKATTEVIATEGINLLKNLEYINDFEFQDPEYYRHGGRRLEPRPRSAMLRDTVYKNPNLTDVEKELFIANQTWNRDGTYTGLEQDLNLSYYRDSTSGQAYQRIPAEQVEVIKFLNSQYTELERIPSPTFDDPTRNITDETYDNDFYGGQDIVQSKLEDLVERMIVISQDVRRDIFHGGEYDKTGPAETFAKIMMPFNKNLKRKYGTDDYSSSINQTAIDYHATIGKEYFNADFIKPEILKKNEQIIKDNDSSIYMVPVNAFIPASHRYLINQISGLAITPRAYEGYEGFQAQQKAFDTVAEVISEGDLDLLKAFEGDLSQQDRIEDIMEDAIPNRSIARTSDRTEAYANYVKSLGNSANPQIAYAQHFVNAFNPYFNPYIRFKMFNDSRMDYDGTTDLYAYDEDVKSIADFDDNAVDPEAITPGGSEAILYTQADYFLNDDPDHVFESMKEALDLFDSKVTAPRLREEAKREVILNMRKAKFLFDRQKMERDFDEAFINYYLPDDTSTDVVSEIIRSSTTNTLEQIAEIDPETARDLQPKLDEKLEELKNSETFKTQLVDEVKFEVRNYMQEHISEFRGSDVDTEALPEKIAALFKSNILSTSDFQEKFGFLSNALKSIAFQQKYDPSNIIAGRDVSRTKFWDFLRQAYPELFRNTPQLNQELPMYQDTVAEINITEANNAPFATPVDPVFMSSYFINENIQKLIPGKPYDAEAMLEFLITPHSAEKPIYPKTTESSLEPVIDPKTNEPRVNPKTGEVIYKAVRSNEEKSKSAKELFGIDSKVNINDEFKDTARKELVNTGLASFLALRYARNRPVTKEELETLLMHNANKTLMTVNSDIVKTSTRAAIESDLHTAEPYGMRGNQIHGQTADSVFRNAEIENFTFNLFNDYPKPKAEMEKLMFEPMSKERVININQAYGGLTDSNSQLNQYGSPMGHPFGVAWLRASVVPTMNMDEDFTADEMAESLRFFDADLETGNVRTKILGRVFVAKESQNDNEEFRGEEAKKLTEATTPFAIKRFKNDLQKLLPSHPLTQKIINKSDEDIPEELTIDMRTILHSDLGILPEGGRGTAAYRTNEQNFAKALKEFFMPETADSSNFRKDAVPFDKRDLFYDLAGLLDITNSPDPEAIVLLPAEEFKKSKRLEKDVTQNYFNRGVSTINGALHSDVNINYIGTKQDDILKLAHMYGAAQNISENNLQSLAFLIDPLTIKSRGPNRFRNKNKAGLRINTEDGVYKWLVGGYATRLPSLQQDSARNASQFADVIREFHPTTTFLNHAKILDLLERKFDVKDNFLIEPDLSSGADEANFETINDFVDRLNANKDSGAYQFLKSVTPPKGFTTDDKQAVEKEAKRIWKNWQKAVEEFKKYTPAIPMLAETKNYPLYKNIAKKDLQNLALRESLGQAADDIESAKRSTIEQPYVGVAQNPFNSPVLREQLGQDYSKLSVRMTLKWVVENLYPGVTSYVVPSRFMNQMHGQYMGAHENFDRMKRELYKIAETSPEAQVEPLIYLRQGIEKTMTDSEINNNNPLIRKAAAKDTNFEKVRKQLIKEIEKDNVKFKNKDVALENDALLDELTRILIDNPLELQAIKKKNSIGLAYSLDLEPLVVEDPNTPSGFSLRKVFRGHRLGGLVGKGIVGLRDEIYNSPLSKHVT